MVSNKLRSLVKILLENFKKSYKTKKLILIGGWGGGGGCVSGVGAGLPEANSWLEKI